MSVGSICKNFALLIANSQENATPTLNCNKERCIYHALKGEQVSRKLSLDNQIALSSKRKN